MMSSGENCTADDFGKLFSQSDGVASAAKSSASKTCILSTSKSTGKLPDIYQKKKIIPTGPSKLNKLTATFNKSSAKSVFNKRNATLEVSYNIWKYFYS